MDLVSLDDNFVNSDAMDTNTGIISAQFAEDVVQQSYKRFLISGGVMGVLAKFMYGDDMNISLQKSLYMAGATLVSDFLLSMAVKQGYVDNSSTGNYKLIGGQVVLESLLYFPIASRLQVFIPDLNSKALQQALISSASSQAVQSVLTSAPSKSS